MTTLPASTHQWIQDLERLREALPILSETTKWRADIDNLIVQLRGETRYAAVFGAFSAGKSSLINALLGEPRLVVSPNPTTAAITHLVPTASEAGLNRVTAKSEAQLWDDVQASFSSLHMSVQDVESAISQASGLQVSQFPATVRKSVSFLKAVAEGFSDVRPRLGTTWETDDEGVRRATAEERQACFIQQVDIGVPSAVFGDGVVMVDTPGVDSIHRRHTDVAFDYMRRADIVLFVVYYTHAFSRADKEFVQQLAGVQDVIGLNKLFVVVNAVDLAKSDEEREAVHARVVTELRQLGIRQPRVYEVSSQIAMAAAQLRQTPDDDRFTTLIRQRLRLDRSASIPQVTALEQYAGVAALQRDVTDFLEVQSAELADSAVRRLQRRVREGVDAALVNAQRLRQQDATLVAAYEAQRRDYRVELENTLKQVQAGASEQEQALAGDWLQLSFHASERIRFRFSSLFREAFHPGRFREGMDTTRGLTEASVDLCTALSRQLEVEARTFALRTHQQAGAALDRLVDGLRQRSLELGVLWEDATNEFVLGNTSVGVEALRASLDHAVIRPAMRHFASARQFFEGGGQQTMLQAVESTLLPLCSAELERLTSVVADRTQTEFRKAWAHNLLDTLNRMDGGSVEVNTDIEQAIVGLNRAKSLLAGA